ncbi:Isopentenyl-diphosphate Delta-isomerase [bioreactor metagenome]|jgi:isopentenyl-diphosphate delta-isomerase|uniref:isopentenyl-diphosphate Delta-isomerase n=1 Tax=bioreactor metagenome TaxID=1076179 RepID=A0A644W9A1_9ZZZZ|nr:isopentenyl-diphosphate Delta-isomerase [Paludibacter sp.]
MVDNDVILVDKQDVAIGSMNKIEAHLGAHLHRAISVFIVNSKGEWLLQQRTTDKYHSKGLWSNACCSHPAPGEKTADAAVRRLKYEMGITAPLTDLFSFYYEAELENGLTEHEIDHVFWGVCDDKPNPNPQEVMDYRYVDYLTLLNEVSVSPEKYSAWFKIIVQQVQAHAKNMHA